MGKAIKKIVRKKIFFVLKERGIQVSVIFLGIKLNNKMILAPVSIFNHKNLCAFVWRKCIDFYLSVIALEKRRQLIDVLGAILTTWTLGKVWVAQIES